MIEIHIAEPAEDIMESCLLCGEFGYCSCEGRDQECRDCGGTLTVHEHAPDWRPKRRQKYYFEKWLRCGDCGALFMLERYKVKVRRRR